MNQPRRKLVGYSVVFIRRDEPSIPLDPEDGRKLDDVLVQVSPPEFVRLTAVGRTVRTRTIDYLKKEFELLDEKCLFCHQYKPLRNKCPRGCDEPHVPNLKKLDEMKKMHGFKT